MCFHKGICWPQKDTLRTHVGLWNRLNVVLYLWRVVLCKNTCVSIELLLGGSDGTLCFGETHSICTYV